MMPEPTPPFTVKAIFQYKSDFEDDLSFEAGQVISVTEIEDEEWYTGSYEGKSGMFPKNFVKIEATSPETTPAGAPIAEAIDAENKEPEKEEIEETDTEDELEQVNRIEEPIEGSSVHPETEGTTGSSPFTTKASAFKHDYASPATTAAKPPMPGVFPNQNVNDPYKIKKQFLATGKSSYIPQVKPRDETNLINHPHLDIAAGDTEIVRESTKKHEEEVNEPKLSLRERIALLQKRQQEEAEREEEALKKKEEKKKKAAEEKERLRKKRETEMAAPAATSSVGEHSEASKRLSIGLNTAGDLYTDQTSSSNRISDDRESNEYSLNQRLEAVEDEDINDDSDKESKDNAEEEPGVEPEEDSDDEELKRKKLVERMAKISGGRNMFGMMGMASPFGQSTASSGKKNQKSAKKHSADDNFKEDEHVPSGQQFSQDSSLPKAIPIFPFANPNSLPKTLVNQQSDDEETDNANIQDAEGTRVEISSSDESSEGTSEKLDSTSKKLEAVSVSYPQESSSMAEEDEFTESDSKFPEAGDAQIHPEKIRAMPPPIPSTLPSDSGVDEDTKNLHDDNIKLNKHTSETEPTGYEADEDLSDLARTSTTKEQESFIRHDYENMIKNMPPPPPPPPTKVSPDSQTLSGTIPQVPSAIPQDLSSVPRTQSRDVPIDSHTLSDSSSASQTPVIPQAPNRELPQSIPKGGPPATNAPPPPIPSTDVSFSISREYDTSSSAEDDTEDETVVAQDTNNLTDNDFEFVPSYPTRSQTVPESLPPPIPDSVPQMPLVPKTGPPPAPSVHVSKRAATDISQSSTTSPVSLTKTATRTSISSLNRRQSTDSSIVRSKSTRTMHNQEQAQAELVLNEIEFEIANINGNSNWWLKGELPDLLTSKVGSELIYETDLNSIIKRSNRVINYRDYYILFYDLSQLIFELEYEKEDPRSTIKLVNYFTKPIPIIRKDLLDKYHVEFSSIIINKASSLLNSKLNDTLAATVLNSLSNIVRPIGNKSFGVTIYKNINNSNIAKIDEIKSGDILWIKNGKFVSHKGLIGSNKLINIGEGDNVYSSIIYEFDPKKEKFKVFESDNSGHVKKESYKLSEFKSGRIRVFRVVGRDYIEW